MRIVFARVLIVALASVLLGGVGGWLLHATSVSKELEGPFVREEGTSAALFNAAMFVTMLLVGALLLLALVRFRISALKLFGYTAFALAAFTVGEVYFTALGFGALHSMLLSIILVALSTILVVLQPSAPYTVAVQVFIGALIGSIIAAMVPPLSMVVMLIAAALYDVYAVYHGPLQRLIQRVSSGQHDSAERRRSVLSPFVVNVGGLALGMGDVILYGSLSSVALLAPVPDPRRLIAVALAVLVGVSITLKLVERRGYAPALPLPVLLSILVLSLYNYVLFGVII